MADKWTSGVITNVGISMLGEVMSGGELIISRAALGGGTVEAAALMAQAELTQPLTVPVVIAQKKLIEGKGLDIRIQIRNTGVSVAQVMRQVGLFAKIGAEGKEKLFAIMQDDVGDEIPEAASYPDFMLEFTAAVAVSNTGNISVIVSGSAVVTKEDLEAALGEMSEETTEKIEKKADKVYVDNALAEKANKGDVPVKVSDLVNDSGFITSPDGGNAATLEGKTASDFAGASDLTTHKNDTTVHITAEERVKWDGKADKSDIPTKLPADGGNADTLDGKHAADFANAYNLNIGEYLSGRAGDIRALAYLLPTGGFNVNTDAVPNVTFPLMGDLLLVWSKSLYTGNDLMYGTLMVRPMAADGDTYICSVFNGSRYTSWQRISDGGNAATLGGKSASDFMEIAVTRGVLQTSLNNLVTPGVYGVQTGVTPDSPSDYGTWGLCEVRAFGSIIYQSIRYDTGLVINRAEIKNQVDWSEWQRTNDGGNASMLGGRSASDFAYRYNPGLDQYLSGRSGDIRALAYLLPVGGYSLNTGLLSSVGLGGLTGFPLSGDIFMVWVPSYWSGGNLYYGMLIMRAYTGGPVYISTIYNSTTYTSWSKLADGGDAASVAGVSVQTNAGSIGLHQMSAGTAAATAANCPAGAWYGQYE